MSTSASPSGNGASAPSTSPGPGSATSGGAPAAAWRRSGESSPISRSCSPGGESAWPGGPRSPIRPSKPTTCSRPVTPTPTTASCSSRTRAGGAPGRVREEQDAVVGVGVTGLEHVVGFEGRIGERGPPGQALSPPGEQDRLIGEDSPLRLQAAAGAPPDVADPGPGLVDGAEAPFPEGEAEVDILAVAERIRRVEAADLEERRAGHQEAGRGAVVDVTAETVLGLLRGIAVS